ncbi:MAG: hypothetical protein HC859_15585 [Bacteroidia bacterium]|nr:hypothetical protein [Bacteroidia bacterium]
MSQFGSSSLFYSRRIGRPPQGGVDTDASGADDQNEYLKPNQSTTILGAAKLSGKNKKGFSWALLESVTQKEFVEVDSAGHKRHEVVEPFTNYFVSRAQQDINKGNTVIGAMFTAVNRRIDDQSLRWLHSEAYSGGVDLLHHWKKRAYYVSARMVMSHVKGSKEAIANTQLSSERFFQRPDNHHTEFDPNRTSLTGTGGQLLIGKKSGNIVSDLGVAWQSPELELNDIGFMPQTDNISQWFWMQYRVLQPKGITRSRRFNINQWSEFDFGGRNLNEGYNINAHAMFKNFWNSGGGITYRVRSASNGDLRGGPSLRYPGGVYFWMYTSTDNRKKLAVEIGPELGFGRDDYSRSVNMYMDITYRPTNALNISLSPSVSVDKNQMQYVATADDSGQERFVVAQIDQTTVRVVMRATYMVTPNLSIQYYGQPFGTAGKYTNFKVIEDADARAYKDRYHSVSPTSLLLNGDGQYNVDEDLDGMPEYSLENPISISDSFVPISLSGGNTYRVQRSFSCGRASETAPFTITRQTIRVVLVLISISGVTMCFCSSTRTGSACSKSATCRLIDGLIVQDKERDGFVTPLLVDCRHGRRKIERA